MEDYTKMTELLQKAVNVMYKAEKYEEAALHVAQKLCLQGEKRRLRYESVKSHNILNYLICEMYDMTGVSLERVHHDVKMPTSLSIKGFFEMYHSKLTEQHEALYAIANELVVNKCSRRVTKVLYCLCDCLEETIIYYNRVIQEGVATGWDISRILTYQTTWCNIHDEYEAKERAINYPGE